MKYLLLSVFLFALFTCKPASKVKYPYTLVDYPDNLRTDLTTIVNYGFIGSPSYGSAEKIRERISDADCKRLSYAEHPILRSLALSILCNRHHLDHYSIMMQHLDDTAYVNWYFQCSSSTFVTVSDYMLQNYHWYTEEQKTKTIDKVIREHNYLQSAYPALYKIQLSSAHYPFVKKMAEREAMMNVRSQALLILAGYKKTADSGFLHATLSGLRQELNCNAFEIMRKYPDHDYFQILKNYYYEGYYRNFCKNGVEGNTKEKALCYVNALAAYQSKESAVILEQILFREPLLPCSPSDTFHLRENFYEAIEKNACKHYQKMLNIALPWLAKERREAALNEIILDTADSFHFPPGSSNAPKISWHQ